MGTYIYGLTDPDTQEIKYIGKSDTPKKRLNQHITDSIGQERKNKKEAWIKSLLNKGLKPNLIIIEKVSDNWQEREKYWIAKYKEQLKNESNGGDGNEGYTHTKESREKMKPSWIKKGQRLSKATEFKKGHFVSKERRKQMSETMKNRKYSKETLKRMSIAQKKSAKTRNLSEKMKGNKYAIGTKWSKERRENQIKIMTGQKRSKETRKKMSLSASKPAIQYDINGNFIREWESAKVAAKELNISYTAINQNLKNHSFTSGGFIWKYKT